GARSVVSDLLGGGLDGAVEAAVGGELHDQVGEGADQCAGGHEREGDHPQLERSAPGVTGGGHPGGRPPSDGAEFPPEGLSGGRADRMTGSRGGGHSAHSLAEPSEVASPQITANPDATGTAGGVS